MDWPEARGDEPGCVAELAGMIDALEISEEHVLSLADLPPWCVE